jgi:1-aminocyclopropane-1-carboxylate deaminase/D-cysteine desulfhydrase-like pyridoxal-dependent ACC family enzyme
MTTEELRAAIDALPRVRLAHLPTPLEEAPRFAARVGNVRVWLKRDDCTGLFFGGNKARHNEFLMADALNTGCDVVVWGAGAQSNNCRQTAAACAKLGLECRLYLSRGTWNTALTGNLLLHHLTGASVELVDAEMGPELETLLATKAGELARRGRKAYVWHKPRVVPLAAVSYALGMAEIAEQCSDLGMAPAAVYVSSSGSTGAGLVLGAKLLGLQWPVRCVAYHRWPGDVREELSQVVRDAGRLLGFDVQVPPAEVAYDTSFIGPGYGKVTPEGREATRQLATNEGVLLDPVYSAKAMAALIDDIHTGRVPAGSDVVFVHTGGTPIVFAYGEEML